MKLPPSLQNVRGGLPPGDDEGALVKMRTLKASLAWIVGMLPTPSRGITVRHSSHGDVWTVEAEASAPLLTVFPTGVVKPGTIGGTMPLIGADRLDEVPAPALTLTGSGTEYVVVTINGTLNVVSGVFVSGLTLADGDVVISVEATDPGPTGLVSDDGTFAMLLATFVDGVKTYQHPGGNWNVEVCDDYSGTATGLLTITVL